VNIAVLVANIEYLCNARGVSVTVACKDSGAGKDFISNIKKGSKPSAEKVQMLAAYLGVSTSDLLGEDVDAPPRDTVRISVLGVVPAGIPIEAIEEVVGWEEIPRAWCAGDKQYFALRVCGDSMWPDFLDGDNVIVRKETTCQSGDVCVVYTDERHATLKQVKLNDDGSITLHPKNPSYPPRTFSASDVSSIPVAIAGVVVELRRKI